MIVIVIYATELTSNIHTVFVSSVLYVLDGFSSVSSFTVQLIDWFKSSISFEF